MQPTASGSKFSVIVYNQFSSATSHVASLNVTTRTNPPVVLAAVSVDGASVTLLWNEPVDPTTAGNKANYSIGGGVTVSDATVSASGLSVTLATSALTISNIYTVTLNGILNGSTRAVPVAPGTTVSFVAQTYAGDVTQLPVLTTLSMLPTGSPQATQRGFWQHLAQADGFCPQVNSIGRAEALLAGTIGPNTYGIDNGKIISTNFETGVINYNDHLSDKGRVPGDVGFPGLGVEPTTPEQDNFAVESDAYIQLSQGIHRFGVNCDDGFAVWSNPSLVVGDPNAVLLGAFNGGRGAADSITFGYNVGGSGFDFIVPQNGLYPLRMIFEKGGGGYSLEYWEKDITNNDAGIGPWHLINGTDGGPAAYAAIPIGPIIDQFGLLRVGMIGQTSVVISWREDTFTLQSSTNVTTGWADIAGAVSPLTNALSKGTKLYRLKK